MKKVNNKKGFTMAELLIVVAIIAVMVAIAIPVFTESMHRAQLGTDMANYRAEYARAVTDAIAKNTTGSAVSLSAAAGAVKYCNVAVDATNHKITFTHAKTSTLTGEFPTDANLTFSDGGKTISSE